MPKTGRIRKTTQQQMATTREKTKAKNEIRAIIITILMTITLNRKNKKEKKQRDAGNITNERPNLEDDDTSMKHLNEDPLRRTITRKMARFLVRIQ